MLSPPGYQGAWVYQLGSNNNGKGSSGKGGASKYSDEWIINDPSATRNRYLFEWWANGVHYIRQDWAIDDNRVVNANEGLKLFTVTLDPLANQYIQHRTAEIDKITYDYYNMYEKIVRGLVTVTSQTPYNPVSNFGNNTIGNFRAVAFSSAILLTPPDIFVIAQKIVSKSEDRFINLNSIKPSKNTKQLAELVEKDPRLVEVILSESVEVVRYSPGVLIVEHRLGHIMANAGVEFFTLFIPSFTLSACITLKPLFSIARANRSLRGLSSSTISSDLSAKSAIF